MSLRSTPRPRSSLRLSTTLRLFGFTQKWADPSPPTALSQWRTMSPPGGSTLMTSAPKSARWRSPSGPLIDTPSETMRTPSRGSTIQHLKIRRVFPAKEERHHTGQGPAGPFDHLRPEASRGRWRLRPCTAAPQAHVTPARGRDHAGPYDTSSGVFLTITRQGRASKSWFSRVFDDAGLVSYNYQHEHNTVVC